MTHDRPSLRPYRRDVFLVTSLGVGDCVHARRAAPWVRPMPARVDPDGLSGQDLARLGIVRLKAKRPATKGAERAHWACG